MQLHSTSKYQKKGAFSFPDHLVDPQEKTSEWHKSMAEAIYSRYLRDNSAMAYSTRDSFSEFRAYGRGRQRVDDYKNRLSIEDRGQQKRKGYMNLDWSVIPIILKYKQVIHGMFSTVEHDVDAMATDKMSGDERFDLKFGKYYKKKIDQYMAPLDAAMGIEDPFDEENMDFVPDNLEELDLWEQMGSYKLKFEAAIEKMINHSMNEDSDWKALKYKLLEDLMDVGIMATKTYVDPITQQLKTRYVDPEYMIIEKSLTHDFRDSGYGGELYLEPMANIASLNKFSEKELRTIQGANSGINHNEKYSHDFYEDDVSRRYEDTKVLVLDCEIVTVDRKYRVHRKTKRGDEVIHSGEFGKSVDKPNKKTKVKDTRVVRKVKWIVGTDLVFDWGLQYDVARYKRSEPMLSYNVYQLKGKSMVEKCIPYVDQFQLTYLKFQNALMQMKNPGIAIEWSALDNISLGGKIMNPKELLTIRRDTGDLLYKMTTHRGGYSNSGAKPFSELSGGMGQQLQEFITMFDLYRKEIADITGITPQASATEPKAGVGLGVSNMAIMSTSNALKPMFEAYNIIKERTALSLGLRAQILLAYSPQAKDYYKPVIGETATEIIAMSKGISLRQLGIKLRVRPTDEEKASIMDAARVALQAGKNGEPGITMSDYSMIVRMLSSGDLRMAEAMIHTRTEKRRAEQQEASQKAIQMQSEENQKLEQLKLANKQTDYQLKTQSEGALIDKKYEWEVKLLQMKLQGEGAKIQATQEGRLMEKAVDIGMQSQQGGGQQPQK